MIHNYYKVFQMNTNKKLESPPTLIHPLNDPHCVPFKNKYSAKKLGEIYFKIFLKLGVSNNTISELERRLKIT